MERPWMKFSERVFLCSANNDQKVTIKWNIRPNWPVNIIGRGEMFYRIIVMDYCKESGNYCHFHHGLSREFGDASHILFW